MPWETIEQVRRRAPLVHNITNYVVMNTTANALLAIGASPVMAHAVEEVEQLARQSAALVINIGTLSEPWVQAMMLAGLEANRHAIPIVFDPVGCGATDFRARTALALIEKIHPNIIRGNASEIRALHAGSGGKGVDSVLGAEEVELDAIHLSLSSGAVVSISGPIDLIVDGRRKATVANGHPVMSKITGMGCVATAITGAFAAVNRSPFLASCHAMAFMGVAGEIAAQQSKGPGSFWPCFLDALALIDKSDITRRLRMEGAQCLCGG